MEAFLCDSANSLQPADLIPRDKTNLTRITSHAKSCWYCTRPVLDRRNFCSTECREALYEDNEYAKKRRLILGCQC